MKPVRGRAFNSTYIRRWLHQRVRRRLVHSLFGRLYRDTDRDVRRSVLVAGSARSGTSWLGEIISAQLPVRIMFEPFHPGLVKDYRRFNYFQYRRPGDDDPELSRFCQRVFSGDIRNRWIDREVEHIRPTYRVAKDIRANLLLKWIHQHFPQVPLLFIIRHPCAVVLSRMELGWATDGDLLPLYSQEQLMEDFLADKIEVIQRAQSAEAKHALIWSITNLVPLRQLQTGDAHGVFYERLAVEPEVEIPAMFRAISLPYHASVLESVDQPSQTATPSSAVMWGEDKIMRWKRRLSAAQIRDILDVVDGFGLGHLYTDSPLPQSEQLWPASVTKQRVG